MKKLALSLLFLSLALAMLSEAQAQIINGDFSNGLQGWTIDGYYSDSQNMVWVSPEGVAILDSGTGDGIGIPPYDYVWTYESFTRLSQSFFVPTDLFTIPDVLQFDMARNVLAEEFTWSSGLGSPSATLYKGSSQIWYSDATSTPTTYSIPLGPDPEGFYTIVFEATSDYAETIIGEDDEGNVITWGMPFVNSYLAVDNVRLWWSYLGATQENPVLPTLAHGNIMHFTNVASGMWFDPPAVSSFVYTAELGTLFAEIMDFPTGFSDSFTVSVAGTLVGEFGPGESVDFVSLFGDGISEFTISGINPLVDAEDPLAFPLQIAFTTPTGSFTMTAVVPEPASALLLLALLGLGTMSRQG